MARNNFLPCTNACIYVLCVCVWVCLHVSVCICSWVSVCMRSPVSLYLYLCHCIFVCPVSRLGHRVDSLVDFLVFLLRHRLRLCVCCSSSSSSSVPFPFPILCPLPLSFSFSLSFSHPLFLVGIYPALVPLFRSAICASHSQIHINITHTSRTPGQCCAAN